MTAPSNHRKTFILKLLPLTRSSTCERRQSVLEYRTATTKSHLVAGTHSHVKPHVDNEIGTGNALKTLEGIMKPMKEVPLDPLHQEALKISHKAFIGRENRGSPAP
jgi:hypothetical protein